MSTARVCPGCSAQMNPFAVSGIELDRCSFCDGLWFDGGELEALLKKPVTPQVEGESARRCTKCNIAMRSAVLARLRVETCTTCHGVFLDEGELVALNDGRPVRVTMEAPPKRAATATVSDAKVGESVNEWLKELGV